MRLAALVLAALPVTAQAQTAIALTDPDTSAQGEVAVTIYNDDLALVQDKRTLDLPSGRTRQEFPDVSASIRPETVTLTGAGIGIVEQNFDFDLLTPQKLMAKAVGRTITLVRTDPVTNNEVREQARVLANNNGTIVQIGNRIEVLERMGDTRVVFASLPPNLRARPTLSVTLDSASAGARSVTLNYLSRGLGWKADYVALFDEPAGKIDVQGWITLTNQSGTTFENARTLLVAGEVAQAQQGQGWRPAQPPRPRGNRAGTQSAAREQLGDYYLYPIKTPTTIANAQTKQVSFLDVAGAPAAKAYEYRNAWLGTVDEAQSAATVLKFSSSREAGLGDALPAGIVRVYMRDARGQSQFIGESAIPHTPMGSSLALKTGEAFDVKVRPVVEKREKIASDEWERSIRYRITKPDGGEKIVTVETSRTYWRTTMRYTLTNARSQPVTVDLIQSGLDNWWHDTRVPSESLPGTQLSSDERVWHVNVPANGETVVTAVFDTDY
jgi:hypothetical protein